MSTAFPPRCPDCDTPLEFLYDCETWVCESCGFTHEATDY
jgi:ribosomal protein L37AE/L43A